MLTAHVREVFRIRKATDLYQGFIKWARHNKKIRSKGHHVAQEIQSQAKLSLSEFRLLLFFFISLLSFSFKCKQGRRAVCLYERASAALGSSARCSWHHTDIWQLNFTQSGNTCY